jgi:hypothetical protein
MHFPNTVIDGGPPWSPADVTDDTGSQSGQEPDRIKYNRHAF